MKSALLASAALLGLAGGAYAADLPDPIQEPMAPEAYAPPPAYTWTGPQVGALVGWNWSTFNTRVNRPLGSYGRADNNTNDFTGGVYAGYNYQVSPNFVVGGEADFTYYGGSHTRPVDGVNVKGETNWLSTVRAKAGFAWERFLVYGTGGVALMDTSVSAQNTKDDGIRGGFAVGGGVEGLVTDHITTRVEYLYTDVGGQDFYTSTGTKVKTDLSSQTVRAGVGYKF